MTTPTTNKSFTQPDVGGSAGTWGNLLNTDLVQIDTAFGGVSSVAVSGAGPYTLTATQYLPPNIILTGAITANFTVNIPSGKGGQWSILNSTTGSFTLSIASLAGGPTVTIPQGKRYTVIADGTSNGVVYSSPLGVPGGSTTQLQYNNSSAFGGVSNSVVSGSGTSTNINIPTITAGVLGTSGNYGVQINPNVSGSSVFLINSPTTNTIAIGYGSSFTGTTSLLTLTQAGILTVGTTVTNLTGSTVDGTNKVGYRNLPQSVHTTLDATDAGKSILATSTITIPNSVFAAGDALTIVNNSASSITITSNLATTHLAGTATVGTTRTLAQWGTATIYFVSATVGIISGPGLT